ncbi:MAG: AMP-binding protein [Acidobacteriota bacterium]|jgi:long-subunit acyl-CoA synthetase (AMP-forming)
MKPNRIWHSELALPEYPPNLAMLLNQNAHAFGKNPIYQELHNGQYATLTWSDFQQDVIRLQGALSTRGLLPGDRVAILSQNRREMLELELAVMAMGAVSVPIYAGYLPDTSQALVEFCQPRMVVVADQTQYSKLSTPDAFAAVIHFDPILTNGQVHVISFEELLAAPPLSHEIRDTGVTPDTITLNMYTSGTMGTPKCVQLTHGNILSQQAAMHVLWKLDHRDRFLSYLPWHHSFGGIYEKYAAITNGALLALEHGFGKNIEILLDNWEKVRPTVFFSVPKIYQEIATRVLKDPGLGWLIFHKELRFVFTAAAPLPKSVSDMFVERGIPVYEAWGLTETSPCCTVTDPTLPRMPGVVGKPIPGVSLKIDDAGEILVRGPNVMKGYFNNAEATRKVLADDGWFATGDIGEFTDTGLRLIARKDRIFKLSNAQKVIPTEIEALILKECAYLSYAFVTGEGRDYPVVLLFPNKGMFARIPDASQLKAGCHCPESLEDMSVCLHRCLREINDALEARYSRPMEALLIDHELIIGSEALTPSMKVIPSRVARIFREYIERLYGSEKQLPDKVYVIHLR